MKRFSGATLLVVLAIGACSAPSTYPGGGRGAGPQEPVMNLEAGADADAATFLDTSPPKDTSTQDTTTGG